MENPQPMFSQINTIAVSFHSSLANQNPEKNSLHQQSTASSGHHSISKQFLGDVEFNPSISCDKVHIYIWYRRLSFVRYHIIDNVRPTALQESQCSTLVTFFFLRSSPHTPTKLMLWLATKTSPTPFNPSSVLRKEKAYVPMFGESRRWAKITAIVLSVFQKKLLKHSAVTTKIVRTYCLVDHSLAKFMV